MHENSCFPSRQYLLCKFWPPIHLPQQCLPPPFHLVSPWHRNHNAFPFQRCFLLLTRSRHARSSQILHSVLQKTPDKDAWRWRGSAGKANVRTLISSSVMIFSGEAGFQIKKKKKKRIVWKHAANRPASACLLYIYTNDGIMGEIIEETFTTVTQHFNGLFYWNIFLQQN